jgi:hypothetical protein
MSQTRRAAPGSPVYLEFLDEIEDFEP